MIAQQLALVALTFASVVAQQRTLVVDGAGPYVEISAALAAARPGDRIEVHPGNYHGFTVSFGVEIIAQQGAQVGGFAGYAGETVAIRNVSAANAVRLDGLTISPNATFGASFSGTLTIAGCAGIVHLHQLTTSQCVTSIHNSSRVGISGCNLLGAVGINALFQLPSAGLLLVNSSAVLDSCTVIGGPGQSGVLGSPSGGGGWLGLELQQSQVFLSSCTIIGGGGGSAANSMGLASAGSGGNGVNGDAISSLCAVGTGSIIGGTGGYGGTYGPGAPGVGITAGTPMSLRLGPAVSFTPPAAPVTAILEPPHVIAPLLLTSNTTVPIQVTGTTDQAVLLGIDIWNDLIRLSGIELPFMLTPAATLYAFAPPQTASTAQFSLFVPPVPWLLGQFVHLQAVTLPVSGGLRFSSGGYGRIN